MTFACCVTLSIRNNYDLYYALSVLFLLKYFLFGTSVFKLDFFLMFCLWNSLSILLFSTSSLKYFHCDIAVMSALELPPCQFPLVLLCLLAELYSEVLELGHFSCSVLGCIHNSKHHSRVAVAYTEFDSESAD